MSSTPIFYVSTPLRIAPPGQNKVFEPRAPLQPRKRQAHNEPAQQLWDETEARLVEAVNLIGSYEMDPAKAIDFPAFNDLTVPETSAMIKALKKANRVKNLGRLDAVPNRQSAANFMEAVDDLFMAIDTAEHNAQTLRWSNLSPAEQKDLGLAQNLLTQASDPGNTKEARGMFYEKLQSVVRRLNELHGARLIPLKAVTAIESSAQKQLLTITVYDMIQKPQNVA